MVTSLFGILGTLQILSGSNTLLELFGPKNPNQYTLIAWVVLFVFDLIWVWRIWVRKDADVLETYGLVKKNLFRPGIEARIVVTIVTVGHAIMFFRNLS